MALSRVLCCTGCEERMKRHRWDPSGSRRARATQTESPSVVGPRATPVSSGALTLHSKALEGARESSEAEKVCPSDPVNLASRPISWERESRFSDSNSTEARSAAEPAERGRTAADTLHLTRESPSSHVRQGGCPASNPIALVPGLRIESRLGQKTTAHSPLNSVSPLTRKALCAPGHMSAAVFRAKGSESGCSRPSLSPRFGLHATRQA